jgi:uncharacterized cofD-like protein
MRTFKKWLQPGIRVKRWLILLTFGLLILGVGFAQVYANLYREQAAPDFIQLITLTFLPPLWRAAIAGTIGACAVLIALYELNNSIVQPIVSHYQTPWVDIVTQHNRLGRGLHVVVIGGGTGLPSVLRGMKKITKNITAVVTMADDGGSSGRLRQEMGVPPPGDLRNNIAALSDDEDMMTRLFQYRFADGALGGHSFGNLFLTALSDITGNMEAAVAVAGRVLAITGRVLPSTLHNTNLAADIRRPDGRMERIHGESNITETPGRIERVMLEPSNAQALPEALRAILSAHLIVIGPGSLYTSILPNLLVRGVVDAIKVTSGQVIYVCNIAQQPGETEDYGAVEHIEALEKHIGTSVIDIVLTNDTFPSPRRSEPTRYVPTVPEDHALHERYRIVQADLTDEDRPWRHDSAKLVTQLLKVQASHEAEKQPKPRSA